MECSREWCSRNLELYADRVNYLLSSPQAPMSRVEPDTFINDRYAAIEDRLQVCVLPLKAWSCTQELGLHFTEMV